MKNEEGKGTHNTAQSLCHPPFCFSLSFYLISPQSLKIFTPDFDENKKNVGGMR